MKIAIVGSRNCGMLTVEKIISNIPNECTEIISGGAIGVDTMAGEAARRLNIKLTEIRPNYAVFGRVAPIVRNRTIVEMCDMVLAFWDYKSNGTRNALLTAYKLEKKVKIIMI